MPPTDEQLLACFQAGELLDEVDTYFGLTELEQMREVHRRCGVLAAAGKMDLLSLVESGEVAAREHRDFFTLQHFFVDAIPHLNEPLLRMLSAVDTLVKLGGEDLAATRPNAALRDWLRKDPARAEAIIAETQAGDATARAHLTFALEVLADPARARTFLESEEPLLRASGITALSRMPDLDPASRSVSVIGIGQALGDGADDMLCANAVEAVLALASQEGGAVETETILPALRRALEARGDGTLNRAAHALWAYQAARRPEVAAILFAALLDLNAAHKGTLDELDLGLKTALDSGRGAEALPFVAALLIKNRGRLKARQFDSLWNAMVTGPEPRLSTWIVTWLISGEAALGAALTEILSNLERDERSLAIGRAELPTSSDELGYLARKAVGWFMLQPHLATSLLVAILGVCDEQTARPVAGLLVTPVLRNYPEMRESLSQTPAEDPARPWIEAAIQEHDRYLDALKAMPEIPELRPSDHNRRIHHLHQADTMRSAHKAAQAQSVFLNLVHHSTLLYGVRSLTYVEDLGGGARRPMEMELGSHEFSMMLPRLEMLDPIGLQLMFLRLRGEARPK